MAFEKKVPDWHAGGTEPPESLKNSGFTPGYKPPADYFNWFFYCVSQCLAELQAMNPDDIGASASSHGHSNATTSAAGFMSPTDKTKLNGVADNANNYSHPTSSGNKHIPSGGSSGQFLGWSADGTAKWTTPSTVTVDSALSTTSTNPVQNKVVNTALGGKAPTSHASTGTTYGAGNGTNYGHVKLSDSTSSTSGASSGVAATPAAVKSAYDLANSANTAASNAQSSANGKAPTNHASTATTYGAGTGTNYGHVKLSDSTDTAYGANDGIAATPAAVKAAYDLANSTKDSLGNYLPLSGGALSGALTVIDNFNVNKTYDSTEYKTYLRPINYSIGSNGDYSAGLILYKGDTNQAQLMFNKDGVMLRDNVAAKAYSLFGQHNASVAATSIRSNLYTYGTTNMTANSSALAEGKMYLQYE